MGWYYGSVTEDIFTGMMIQGKGWKSIYLNPQPAAFLGCAPTNGPSTFTQLKRWTTGFLEILLTKNCPIFGAVFGKLDLKVCMFYLWIYLWGPKSIPELCYSILPAYSLLTNSHFLPQASFTQNTYIYIYVCYFFSTVLSCCWLKISKCLLKHIEYMLFFLISFLLCFGF